MNSIDWLIEKYTIVCGLGSKELMKEHIERAKAMHKEEIIESYASGSNDRLKNVINTEYYNETFKI